MITNSKSWVDQPCIEDNESNGFILFDYKNINLFKNHEN